MKKILLLLFVLINISCSSDSPSEPSKQPYEIVNGEWEITIFDNVYTYNITPTKNYCYFLGDKYDGSLFSKEFTGTFKTYKDGANIQATLILNVVDDNNISGNLLLKVIIDNKGYYDTDNFIGTRTQQK